MRRLGYTFGITSALVGLGVLERLQGAYERAVALCEECLAVSREALKKIGGLESLVDYHLLAPRWLGHERIHGGLQAGLCPAAGREQVVTPHRLANGK